MPQTLTHLETKDSISITTPSDGGKNIVYIITGTIEHEDDSLFDIFDMSKLEGSPPTIRLDGLLYAIESGLKLFLRYRDMSYIIPLEGRNKMDLEWVGGLLGHEVDLVCKGTGSFFLVIDCSKMGV